MSNNPVADLMTLINSVDPRSEDVVKVAVAARHLAFDVYPMLDETKSADSVLARTSEIANFSPEDEGLEVVRVARELCADLAGWFE
ncbi:MAG: hypothetical protein U5O16_14175 [Rhodococcus sp. (in: high G+C Gram-positive bacteria)]|uniref:hypothetical protein n=1 Tax=Rhodococcus sp. TaxID=1831 RepID=UPI002AD83938|nr:hypothetical protein [Rhodococcus sp. (in: high G+C Gram-positive bacteria)]